MDNSYWFGDTVTKGVIKTDGKIIDKFSHDITRFESLYAESQEGFSDPNIYYDINEYGYRCPPFETIDYNKIQVITAGCSFTFGMGISEGTIGPTFTTEITQSVLSMEFRCAGIFQMMLL